MGPYIQQSLLLLLAPALFAASIYMILGRMILRLDSEKLCIFKKKWLTKFFVAGDILSFSVQAAGKQRNSQCFIVLATKQANRHMRESRWRNYGWWLVGCPSLG
jgi:hypothetical protein